MDVRVDQARQDGLALEIDDLGAGALGFQHLVVAADLEDLAALDGNRLVNGELLVDGDDLAVVQDQVGISGASGRRQQGHGGEQRDDAKGHGAALRESEEDGAGSGSLRPPGAGRILGQRGEDCKGLHEPATGVPGSRSEIQRGPPGWAIHRQLARGRTLRRVSDAGGKEECALGRRAQFGVESVSKSTTPAVRSGGEGAMK